MKNFIDVSLSWSGDRTPEFARGVSRQTYGTYWYLHAGRFVLGIETTVPSEVPWYYRFRPTNWLMAKPWRWNYRAIWQDIGQWQTVRENPLWRLWYTLAFPHVHHPSEDEEIAGYE